MTENSLQFNGIRIIENEKLFPHEMKVKGFYNKLGNEIVQEIEVSEDTYLKLRIMCR